MRPNLMIIAAFIGTFALAGLAPAASSAGGHGGGGAASGGAGHGGGTAAAGVAGHGGGAAAHGVAGHASARLGSRIASIGPGTREESELAKLGFVDAHDEQIDGHHATVAVFHRASLTASERDRIYHYHFKGFNECAGHGACAEPKAGGEMYCRKARNVAITSDLECLSFRASE
jgi:hypothetical protein